MERAWDNLSERLKMDRNLLGRPGAIEKLSFSYPKKHPGLVVARTS